MASIPAMPAPDGLVSDFNRPTGFPDVLKASFAVSSVMATIVLALRLYTKVVIKRDFNLNDGLIIPAWVLALAYGSIMIFLIDHGFGKHLWNVPAPAAAKYLQLLGPSVMTYSWSISTTKLSMLSLYYRIHTNVPNKPFRVAICGTAGFIIAYQAVFTGLFVGRCNPTKPGTGDCLSSSAVAQVILNIISDIVVLLIPMSVLVRLQMARKMKVLLIAIVALGSGAVIVSAVKVYYVIKLTGNPDFTYTQSQPTILSIWEANLGICCNNLVLLWPLVERVSPWIHALIHSIRSYRNAQKDCERLPAAENDRGYPGHNGNSVPDSGSEVELVKMGSKQSS